MMSIYVFREIMGYLYIVFGLPVFTSYQGLQLFQDYTYEGTSSMTRGTRQVLKDVQIWGLFSDRATGAFRRE